MKKNGQKYKSILNKDKKKNKNKVEFAEENNEIYEIDNVNDKHKQEVNEPPETNMIDVKDNNIDDNDVKDQKMDRIRKNYNEKHKKKHCFLWYLLPWNWCSCSNSSAVETLETSRRNNDKDKHSI